MLYIFIVIFYLLNRNKDTDDKEQDYFVCLSRLSPYAGYLTINISSPNTEGLRDFHEQKELKKLLEGLNKVKKDKNILKPLVLKLSPDIDNSEVSKLIEIVFNIGNLLRIDRTVESSWFWDHDLSADTITHCFIFEK